MKCFKACSMQFQMQFFHFLMKLRMNSSASKKKRAAGFFLCSSTTNSNDAFGSATHLVNKKPRASNKSVDGINQWSNRQRETHYSVRKHTVDNFCTWHVCMYMYKGCNKSVIPLLRWLFLLGSLMQRTHDYFHRRERGLDFKNSFHKSFST